ncbi:MAG: glycosyltransferase family 2 protein [Ilumatobacter sp.]|nr:MAG: glycosyltransferase family 2 protein [Ilumatobacter sp.]
MVVQDHSVTRPRTLIIQIPCLDEEATLPATVADLPTRVDGFDVVEWLVIDDGSSDRTSAVARELGVHHVVRHTRNRGLAAAFLTGLDAALRAGADVIVNTDADNQYSGASIPALVAPVTGGRADIVVGERPIESIPEFSWVKKRLQRVGSWVVRRFSGTEIADAASGFRAFSRDAAMRLQVFGRHTYTLETLVQAGVEGLAVTSVPVEVNPPTRESRLVRSSGQYVRRSAQAIVRAYVLYRPLRFFFVVGLVPFLVGVALVVRWLVLFGVDDVYRSRIPSLLTAALFVLVAVQVWALGFVADLQAASRRIQSDIRLRQRRNELDAGR